MALLAFTLGWLLLLFAIARAAESKPAWTRLSEHPLIYAMSLGVYATSWTFFGAVGFARTHGVTFIAVCLGPTLAGLLVPSVFLPLLRLVRRHQLATVADLFAFRYRSQALGATVTLAMLFGVLPYLAVQVRAAYLMGPNGRVGVSGLATSIIMGLGKTDQRRAFAGGATAFADVTFGRTTLRGELSVGQNLANIGMLSIGFGGVAHDMPEWGGFISVRHGFTDMHFVYANAGLMRVLARSNVAASYTNTTASDGVVTSALGTTGPGMLHNAGATLGYELRISKNLGFLLEGFVMQTEFQLLSADLARFNPVRQATGGELAAVVTF